MAEQIIIDVGDSLTIYEVPVVDGDGKAVDLTGGAVWLFAKGRTNGDKPSSTAIFAVANCGFTIDTKTVTCPATAGIVIGQRVIHAQARQGAFVTAITANTNFTMSEKAIATQATQSVQFWTGVAMDISGDLDTLGTPRIQGLGALLSPGTLTGTNDEVYDDEVAYKTAGGLWGISSRSTFIGRRPL